MLGNPLLWTLLFDQDGNCNFHGSESELGGIMGVPGSPSFLTEAVLVTLPH